MTEQKLKVIVHYAAAKKPYEQNDVSRSETVGTLKTDVLNAFGLKEGQGGDGNTYTYTLYYQKTALENLNETLGQVAGDKHTLELKLKYEVMRKRGLLSWTTRRRVLFGPRTRTSCTTKKSFLAFH
jgi:hypothetical protein